VLRQHGFNTILLEPNTPLLFMLEHLPGWELVYRDEQALIYCRRGRDPLMNSPEVIVPKGAGAA
jgi:hypothetical protein